MSSPAESRIIQRFRACLNQARLEGINVTYRVSGGMPAEGRVGEELKVSGNNLATVRAVTGLNLPQEASREFSSVEIQALLKHIEQGIDGLVPSSEAQFLPDSVLGSITLEIDGEQATFYFLIDEDDRINQNKPIAPAIVEAIDIFSTFSQELLQQGGN